MKKFIMAMILVVALAASACLAEVVNPEESYAGGWSDEAQGVYADIVINEDGTLAATTNGEADGEGEWEESEDGISITDATGSEMSGVMDGEQLIVDFGDDFIVTMEKAE